MTDLAQANRDLEAVNDLLTNDCADKAQRITELESALLEQQRINEGQHSDIQQLRRNQRREWNRIGGMAEVIDTINERIESDGNTIHHMAREVTRLENLCMALQMSRVS